MNNQISKQLNNEHTIKYMVGELWEPFQADGQIGLYSIKIFCEVVNKFVRHS